MGYEISLNLAWNEMERLAASSRYLIPFLGDDYEVEVGTRSIRLKASGASAGQMQAVLILHYLIGLLEHGFHRTGDWISFREAKGGKEFWPAFRESTIKPLIECFEIDPEGLVKNIESHGGRTVEGGDMGIEIATFPKILVRIIFWRSDEDLPGEAAMLFDRGLLEIYSTEDVAVLLMLVALFFSKVEIYKSSSPA
jgi:hypothetical protein